MLLQEPNDEFLQYAIVMEYVSAGRIGEAIEGLEKILLQNNNYLAAYYQLGKCFEAQNKINEAKAAYEKGIAVAQAQKNAKTLNELREAIFLLED